MRVNSACLSVCGGGGRGGGEGREVSRNFGDISTKGSRWKNPSPNLAAASWLGKYVDGVLRQSNTSTRKGSIHYCSFSQLHREMRAGEAAG